MANGTKTAMAVGGNGSITVSGSGQPGELITVVIRKGGALVKSKAGNLDGTGHGSFTFPVLPGTYDVSITAADGTVYDFPDTVVN
jgi:hypothetical protein